MPDKLTIRIRVEPVGADTGGQTVSRFAIEEKGQVTFYNDAAKVATVEFTGRSPFCQGSNAEPLSFSVQPGTPSPHKVCKNIADMEFKYKATVLDALQEDPILIIERAPSSVPSEPNPIIWVESLIPFIVGAVLGAIGAFIFTRRRGTRGP